MPFCTIFGYYKPCVLSGLWLKGETIYSNGKPIDYTEQDLLYEIEAESSEEFVSILMAAENTGKPFSADLECFGRNGLFEDEQLYVIWERDDILKLAGLLLKVVPAI